MSNDNQTPKGEEQDPCNYCGKTLREQMKGCTEMSCYRQYLSASPTPAEEKGARPNIKDYFGESTTLQQVLNTYKSQPELFNYAQALDLYIDELEAAPAPQQEAAQGKEVEFAPKGWISVEDGLPKEDCAVLCYDKHHNQRRVLCWNKYHHVWDDESGDDYYTDAVGGKVTHWQPLPAPPDKQ